jgi:nitroreductase
MDVKEAILTRRSIREYTDRPISEEDLQALLRAAMYAPSSGNSRPWQFIVVTDRELLDKVAEVHPNADMTRQAQAGILVCGDPQVDRYRRYWPQDCAAATQNLLLMAHALGIGAVWTGVHPVPPRERRLRKLFGMPEEVTPFAFIPLGYPAETRTTEERFDESRVHRNAW